MLVFPINVWKRNSNVFVFYGECEEKDIDCGSKLACWFSGGNVLFLAKLAEFCKIRLVCWRYLAENVN